MDKIWAIIFHVLKFEVTRSTPLKIADPFLHIHWKTAALSIFSKICQKCILFGQYCLTPQIPGTYFY